MLRRLLAPTDGAVDDWLFSCEYAVFLIESSNREIITGRYLEETVWDLNKKSAVIVKLTRRFH